MRTMSALHSRTGSPRVGGVGGTLNSHDLRYNTGGQYTSTSSGSHTLERSSQDMAGGGLVNADYNADPLPYRQLAQRGAVPARRENGIDELMWVENGGVMEAESNHRSGLWILQS